MQNYQIYSETNVNLNFSGPDLLDSLFGVVVQTAKQISANSYENGVVLVRCPGCQSLHLIADRLGYFESGGAGAAVLPPLHRALVIGGMKWRVS